MLLQRQKLPVGKVQPGLQLRAFALFAVDQQPLADFLESLNLLRSMDDYSMMPAHGPTGGRVHARVDELLAHHAQRLDDIVGLLSAESSTPFEIASQMTWTRKAVALADLPAMHQVHGIREVVSHLEVLADRGLATASPGGDGPRYST